MARSMPSITFSYKGDWKKTRNFLKTAQRLSFLSSLDKYGQEGVEALRAATPVRTGKTADSWSYEIERTADSVTLRWVNSSNNKSIPIVLLLQYGHMTGTGGYVQGIDFINPALKPIFDKIAKSAWEEVRRS